VRCDGHEAGEELKPWQVISGGVLLLAWLAAVTFVVVSVGAFAAHLVGVVIGGKP
jgi:hypothetical protein